MVTQEIPVVVIGAGQAGLAVSRELGLWGIGHVVVERRAEVGGSWADRWDSFRMVLPNRSVRLPGEGRDGWAPIRLDPEKFMARDEILGLLREFATANEAPVLTNVAATAMRPLPDGRVSLVLTDLRAERETHVVARAVVVATGANQLARRPGWVEQVPAGTCVISASDYRNPSQLPEGAVLLVGSGQTGCQLAEELALAGRRVVLASGRAPWVPRRVGDRDVADWLIDLGIFEETPADLPSPAGRFLANPQATGVDGGHDLHSRTLQRLGVELAGHLTGVEDGVAVFADDLAESIQFGDDWYLDFADSVREWCAARGRPAPELPPPAPFDAAGALQRLDLREVGSVILTAGFRPDLSWIDAPGAVDVLGSPIQVEGASTVVPGLFFAGFHFQRKRKSSLLLGVWEDAAIVAAGVASRLERK